MKNTNEKPMAAIVDYGTGEVIRELYRGDKIVTSEQQEYNNKYKTNFNKKEVFIKVYIDPITELYRTLTTKETAVCLGIMPYISYKDGILRYNNKIIDIKTISELLDENYDVLRRTLSSLCKKEVLKKIEVVSDTNVNKTRKCFVVNPYIFFKGVDLDRKIMKEFENTRWANI